MRDNQMATGMPPLMMLGAGFDPAGRDSASVIVVSRSTRFVRFGQGVAASVLDEKNVSVNKTQNTASQLQHLLWRLFSIMPEIEPQLVGMTYAFSRRANICLR